MSRGYILDQDVFQPTPAENWSLDGQPNEYRGKTLTAIKAGSSLQTTFTGSHVAVYGTLDHEETSTNYRVDADTPANVKLPAGPPRPHHLLWESDKLVEGLHALEIVLNSTMKDRSIFFDYMLVQSSTASASNEFFVDDKDPALVFSDNWVSRPQDHAMGQGYKSAAAGSAMGFSFQGTGATLYGTMTPQTNVEIAISLDGNPSESFPLEPSGRAVNGLFYQQVLWTKSGLEDKVHSVVVRPMSEGLGVDYLLLAVGGVIQNFTGSLLTPSRSLLTSATSTSTAGSQAPTLPGPNTKLNIAAIAGGGVAGAIMVMLVGFLLGRFWHRRRRRGKTEDQYSVEAPFTNTHHIFAPEPKGMHPNRQDLSPNRRAPQGNLSVSGYTVAPSSHSGSNRDVQSPPLYVR